MGRRRKLNRFISRWVKSDLPEERSTVLLLGVTRIPPSPKAPRRPCSLPIGDPPPCRPASRRGPSLRRGTPRPQTTFCLSTSPPLDRRDTPKVEGHASGSASASVPLPSPTCLVEGGTVSGRHGPPAHRGPDERRPSDEQLTVMDRSVDSIGSCSLDVDASAEYADLSDENSSTATLRSSTFPQHSANTPTITTSIPSRGGSPKLPSYLSLACTINGYSVTTNYDPDRLVRSRDTSPHRHNVLHNHHLTFTVRNNLLSPPNVVPLPQHKFHVEPISESNGGTVAPNVTMSSYQHHHHKYFSSSKSTITSNSTVADISELRDLSVGEQVQNDVMCEKTTAKQHLKDANTENKTFIQQRIERLYGPGALAQGFFISRRNKQNKSYTETKNANEVRSHTDTRSHSVSLNESMLFNDVNVCIFNKSISNPELPVLRHLRPEFRAQLKFTPKKCVEDGSSHKTVIIPVLLEEEPKANGHSMKETSEIEPPKDMSKNNGAFHDTEHGSLDVCDKVARDIEGNEAVVRDGHYFLAVLDKETQRLLRLADKTEQDLDIPNLSEEAKGYLRSAFGKARLLVSQKMQQFRGLCSNNVAQVEGEAFPTTNEDLQGFWDMIMLQVDQVDKMFQELETLKANNWVEVKATNGTSASKPKKKIKTTRPISAAAVESRKQREIERKKLIEERRKAMKEYQQGRSSGTADILVTECS